MMIGHQNDRPIDWSIDASGMLDHVPKHDGKRPKAMKNNSHESEAPILLKLLLSDATSSASGCTSLAPSVSVKKQARRFLHEAILDRHALKPLLQK